MTPQQVNLEKKNSGKIDFNGQIERMLTDFLRYPGVFKKSVRGEMCLFCRYIKICPRENFLKNAP